MRVADKMSFNQVNMSLNRNRADLHGLQGEAATQKQVNKPSDDPIAATRVLKQRTEIQGIDQYIKNITAAKNFMELSEQSLGELTEILTRAKELAISQAGDSGGNSETRRVVAAEVEQIFGQAVNIGNRKLADRFLFGGFRTTVAPFSKMGEYRGDNGEMQIPIDKEAKVAINIPGSAIFLGNQLGKAETSEPQFELPPELRVPVPNNSSELVITRGPASEIQVDVEDGAKEEAPAENGSTWKTSGVNIFNILNDLKISLQANDKVGVQESLDRIDESLAQVILSRSQYGARVGVLDHTLSALQRSNVDAKVVKSQAEDVDAFELVTDINRAENTLKTSLSTSGKLLQPSLLDFLR